MSGPLLTLEPLIDSLRKGIEGAGWALSGMQKTTSHQFEGRWEGESTRSAYLFFHGEEGPDFASVDVYLDETGRGLTGNLALVVDLADLGGLGPAEELMTALAAASTRHLPEAWRRPLTLRFRMADTGGRVEDSETEVRFKVLIPRTVIAEGDAATAAFAARVVDAFQGVITAPELRSQLSDEDREG